jgi:hypothetical protein
MPPLIDITAQRFGRLSVLERSGTTRGGQILWLCRCDCGKQVIVQGGDLRKGATRSCGCLRSESTIKNSLIHGNATRGKMSPEYRSWRGMKQRCTDPKAHNYKYYGARGITVCARWLNSFEHFLADMGRKPGSDYSIDRRNNDGNYEPANCHWATQSEQVRNQR